MSSMPAPYPYPYPRRVGDAPSIASADSAAESLPTRFKNGAASISNKPSEFCALLSSSSLGSSAGVVSVRGGGRGGGGEEEEVGGGEEEEEEEDEDAGPGRIARSTKSLSSRRTSGSATDARRGVGGKKGACACVVCEKNISSSCVLFTYDVALPIPVSQYPSACARTRAGRTDGLTYSY